MLSIRPAIGGVPVHYVNVVRGGSKKKKKKKKTGILLFIIMCIYNMKDREGLVERVDEDPSQRRRNRKPR